MAKKKLKKNFKFLGLLTAILGVGILGFLVLKLSSNYSFCANSESCIEDLSGTYDQKATLAEFMGEEIPVPKMAATSEEPKKVLAEASGIRKRIEVDLTTQTLYAFENDQVVMSFPVSTGKWSHTPTGTYKIWIKLRATRMSGGKPGTGSYYNLPNVPYTMYFYNDKHPKAQGYGLHGAYWHNNFGHPMSHGCVNISPENAEKLYNWAEPTTQKNTTYATDGNPGTTIIIYGETPRE